MLNKKGHNIDVMDGRRNQGMPYDLPLPQHIRQQGWKVKIRERERLEPPHVSIMRKIDVWRVGLRDCEFMEAGTSWSDIPKEVRAAIEKNWELLQNEWDSKYPDNPVAGGEAEHE